jgi:DNA-binding transcriptional regulator WhiA
MNEDLLKAKIRKVTEEDSNLPVFSYSKMDLFKSCPFSYDLKSSFTKKRIYKISVNTMSKEIIEDLEIAFSEGKISKNIVRNDDTISGYLAGAFLAG